jgi:hypothetical protein
LAPGAEQAAAISPQPEIAAALAQATGLASPRSASLSTNEPDRLAGKGSLRLGGIVALSGSVVRELALRAASPSGALS